MTNKEGLDAPESQGATFEGVGGSLTSGRRVYAIGLIWETRDSSAKIKSIAREAAKLRGANLFCVRAGAQTQYGLGSTTAGHKQGMPSLAAFLTEVLDGSFVAAFSVGEGYYIVAARDNIVLAGYDRVFASADEALESFQGLSLLMTWDQRICPKEWDIEDSTYITLEDALGGERPKTKLESVSQVSRAIRIGGMLSILVLVVGGFLAYEGYKADMEDERRAALERERAMERARLEAARHKLIIPAFPWEGNPLGYYVIQECVDKILSTKIDIAGWRVEKVTCSLQRAQVTPEFGKRPITAPAALAMQMVLKRDGGTINWIGESLNNGNFRPEVVQAGGDSAAVIWKTPSPAPVFPAESEDNKTTSAPQGNLIKVSKYLITNFDELFTDIDIKEAQGTPVKVAMPRGNPISATLERHIDFVFRTKENPQNLNNLFFPVSGLIVNKVELNLNSWEWSVSGDVYERVPLPTQDRFGK